MATSETYAWSPAMCDVIINAYGRCQVRRAELTPDHLHDAAMSANLLQSEWANDQVNLWTVDMQTIQLIPGVATYDVDPSTVMIMATWISIDQGGPDKDTIITSIDRDTYGSFPDKQKVGKPSVYWYEALRQPRITLWQMPDDRQPPMALKFYRARQLQDASLPDGLEPDVPYRFVEAYTAGLAAKLAEIWRPERQASLLLLAEKQFKKAKERDVEHASLRIVPAMTIYTDAVYGG